MQSEVSAVLLPFALEYNGETITKALGDASLLYSPRELRYGDIIEILIEAY